MRKTKKIIFSVLITLIIILIIFVIAEIFSRIVMGKRLIVKVEENGLYHFKPNQRGWYGGPGLGLPKATINNIGARGKDVDINLLNKTKKYIFFGDSFTFGWVLEDDETISYYFMKEKNLTSNNIINYGNGGYGIKHMIAAYEFYKSLFAENDTIIVILIESDLYREMAPYKRSIIKELFWKVREKSSSISWVWATIRYTSVAAARQEKKQWYKGLNLSEENKEIFLNFNEEVNKDKRNLVYVFYEYNQTSYSDKTKIFCEENGLLCITNVYDYIEIVEKSGKDIYSIDKGHPSAESNNEVAKGIVNFINKNGI